MVRKRTEIIKTNVSKGAKEPSSLSRKIQSKTKVSQTPYLIGVDKYDSSLKSKPEDRFGVTLPVKSNNQKKFDNSQCIMENIVRNSFKLKSCDCGSACGETCNINSRLFTHSILINELKANTTFHRYPKKKYNAFVESGALWNYLQKNFHPEFNSDKESLDVSFSFLSLPRSADGSRRGESPEDIHVLDRTAKGFLYAAEYKIKRLEIVNGEKLLKLQDPEGKYAHWNGKWSQFDRNHWTPHMQQVLEYKLPSQYIPNPAKVLSIFKLIPKYYKSKKKSNLEKEKEREKIAQEKSLIRTPDFWINLKDIVINSSVLRVRRDVSSWNYLSMTGRWIGVTAGGPPNQPKAVHNPQYQLRLMWGPRIKLEKSLILISISSSTLIDSVNNAIVESVPFPKVNLLLLDLKGNPYRGNLCANEMVDSTCTYRAANVTPLTIETELPRNQDIVYTLLPSTSEIGEEGEFRIDIYCQVPVECYDLVNPRFRRISSKTSNSVSSTQNQINLPHGDNLQDDIPVASPVTSSRINTNGIYLERF